MLLPIRCTPVWTSVCSFSVSYWDDSRERLKVMLRYKLFSEPLSIRSLALFIRFAWVCACFVVSHIILHLEWHRAFYLLYTEYTKVHIVSCLVATMLKSYLPTKAWRQRKSFNLFLHVENWASLCPGRFLPVSQSPERSIGYARHPSVSRRLFQEKVMKGYLNGICFRYPTNSDPCPSAKPLY